MKIRLIRDRDYAATARFHRQTIRQVNAKDYPKDIIEAWSSRPSARRLRKSADRCKRWVAVEDGKIVGVCDHSMDNEFWGLYVHKDYLGQGIGSRLLKTAEDSLKKRGCKKVTLNATITAKNFYKKQGYKIGKKSFSTMGGKQVAVFVMTKVIN